MHPARLAELTALASDTVEEVRRALPEGLRRAAAECPTILLTLDAWEAEQGESDGDGLLGLFLGLSRAEGEPAGPEDAPRILLFLDSLWDWAEEERARFAEEVETTFLHELGHYLGLDEDEVADRGLA